MLSRVARGYALGALAAASYGTNPLFAVPLYRAGMTPDSVLFWRYLLAIPLVGMLLAWRAHRRPAGTILSAIALKRQQVWPLAAMGLTMGVSSLTLFASYNYMNVGIASTLLFVYPILVALIMSALFGERFRVATAVSLVVATAGIAMLYRAGDGRPLGPVGILLVALSSLSYAIYIVGTSQTSLRSMPALSVSFYVLLFGLLLFVGRLSCTGGFQWPPLAPWWTWLDVIALAVFPTLISFLCTTAAIGRIGPTSTAILGALEPVAAVLLGMVFLGESITVPSAIGMALILVAVTIVVAGAKLPHAVGRLLHLDVDRTNRQP